LLTSANTQRRVLGVDSLLVVLKLLGGDIESQVVADESRDSADLDGGKLPLRFLLGPNLSTNV
jgi:hypothetical protein